MGEKSRGVYAPGAKMNKVLQRSLNKSKKKKKGVDKHKQIR